jgi:PST family polysaccharide transporter
MAFRTAGLVVLARLIAPEDFGLVAIVTTIGLFASNLILMGLNAATIQHLGITSRAKSSLFLINVAMGLIVAGGMFALAPTIAEIYNEPLLETIVRWNAIVPLLSGLQGQFLAQVIADLKFAKLAIAEVASQAAAFVIPILIAAFGYGLAAIVALPIVQSAALLVGTVAAAKWFPGRPGDWTLHVKPVMRVGLHVFGMNASRQLGRSALLPVIGLYQPMAAVGAFDRAQNLAVLPVNLTVDQMQRVAIPVLTRLRDDRHSLLKYFARAQLVVSYSTGTALALTAAVADPLVTVALGENWQLAGRILALFAVGSIFRALAQAVQWLYISDGVSGRGAVFVAVSQPIIIAISLLGLLWDIEFVALFNSIAWLLYWPVSSLVASRLRQLPVATLILHPLRGALGFAAPIGAAAWSAATWVPGGDSVRVLVGIAAGVALAGILAFVPPIRRDLTVVKETIKLAASSRAGANGE